MFAASVGYERFMGRWSRRLAPALVEFAGARDGERVLDLGCGTGALASVAAAMLPSSAVTGVDPSEPFVVHARGNATSGRVVFEVGDARALRFDPASFDRSIALLVLNFVPEPAKAVGEMRRVTRPGGTVSACVWDYDSGMQMLRLFWDEAVALDPAVARIDERNMPFARRGELGDLWASAGLVDVRESPLEIGQEFDAFDDYWAPFLAGVGPAGAHVASLPEPQRGELAARLRHRTLGGRPDRAFRLTARAWGVCGVVPADVDGIREPGSARGTNLR